MTPDPEYGERAGDEGGSRDPEEVREESETVEGQTLLSKEGIQRAQLLLFEDVYDLSSALDMVEAAYLGCEALVLARAMIIASSETSPAKS